jgi:hypothetical protein
VARHDRLKRIGCTNTKSDTKNVPAFPGEGHLNRHGCNTHAWVQCINGDSLHRSMHLLKVMLYEKQCHVQATSGQLQRCLHALAKHELFEETPRAISPRHPRRPASLRHGCLMSMTLRAETDAVRRFCSS